LGIGVIRLSYININGSRRSLDDIFGASDVAAPEIAIPTPDDGQGVISEIGTALAQAGFDLPQSAVEVLPLEEGYVPGKLYWNCCEALDRQFEEWGQRHSKEQHDALRDILFHLEMMAEGKLDSGKIYLSSLDPGIGKTTAYTIFIRNLLKSERHTHVSVLVCLNRVDEIRRTVEEMQLSEKSYAVFVTEGQHRDDKGIDITTYGLGVGRKREARVLFTTQQMIDSRMRKGEAEEFHYGRGFDPARTIKIWDESILPGRSFTVRRDQIAAMLDPLNKRYPKLRDDLEHLIDGIRAATTDHSYIEIDDLAPRHKITLVEMREILKGKVERDGVDALWTMLGRTVNIVKQGKRDAAISYEDNFYEALKPILVLDASGRVRDAYAFWEESRKDLVRLKAGSKDYSNLTIHVWERRACGEDALGTDNEVLLGGIAETINAGGDDDKWLIIHHKQIGDKENNTIDPGAAIKGQLFNQKGQQVSCINWGSHASTNDYKDISNIILAGMFFKPEAYYHSTLRLSAKLTPQEKAEKEKVSKIRDGETKHDILQALCRGKVRQSEGSGCPPCHAYIICSKSIRDKLLPEVFPNAQIMKWGHYGAPPSENGKRSLTKAVIAAGYLDWRNEEKIYVKEVYQYLDMDQSNFNRLVLNDKQFRMDIESSGIELVRQKGKAGSFFLKHKPET
jgi:hypothetical protein